MWHLLQCKDIIGFDSFYLSTYNLVQLEFKAKECTIYKDIKLIISQDFGNEMSPEDDNWLVSDDSIVVASAAGGNVGADDNRRSVAEDISVWNLKKKKVVLKCIL